MKRAMIGLATVGMLAVTACSDDGSGDGGPDVTFATTPVQSTEPPAVETTAGGSSPATDPSVAPSTTEPGEPLGDPSVVQVPIDLFDQPVDLRQRIDDPTLYVVEQPGTIIPWRDGVAGPPVLDISDRTNSEGEQGLLGLAFSPDGQFAYINYSANDSADNDGGATVIVEYFVNDDGTFDVSSARELLRIAQPYPNHNGGGLAFGPDGMLYIGMGDGGSGGDPERYSLNVSSLLGKILRIDPSPADGTAYTVPGDNPYVGVAGARPEIWSVGVRNPWRFSFDSETGDLWIADVGQNEWEEISVARAADGGGRGVNFGWSAFEGTHRFNEDQSPDGTTPPVWEYAHGAAGCSISGGALYRGAAIPELVGWYVYADFCSGEVRGLQFTDGVVSRELLLATGGSLTAVVAGTDGELYVLSRDGEVTVLARA